MADVTGDGQDHSIRARDVRPGMVVWNPYGGARGRALVASEPRERPDGAVEFDTADGRTGVFRPHFRLHFDRAATERLAAERDAERQPPAGTPPGIAEPGMDTEPERQAAETGPGRTEIGVTADGRDAQTLTTTGPITSLSEPKTGKAAAAATQAVLDAINSGQLRAGQLEGCDFWTGKAAQQRMQAEVDPGPAERQLEDWNIHNDHADGLAADYDLDREA